MSARHAPGGRGAPYVALRHDPSQERIVYAMHYREFDTSAIRNPEPLRMLGVIPMTWNSLTGVLVKGPSDR